MPSVGEPKQYTKIWERNKDTVYGSYIPHEIIYDDNGVKIKEVWRKTHFDRYFGDLRKRYFKVYDSKSIDYITGKVVEKEIVPSGKYTTRPKVKASYVDHSLSERYKNKVADVKLKKRVSTPSTFKFSNSLSRMTTPSSSYKLGTEGTMDNLSKLTKPSKYSLNMKKPKLQSKESLNQPISAKVALNVGERKKPASGAVYGLKQTNNKKKKEAPSISGMISKARPKTGTKYSFK